jgi:hypothetical protein
MFINLLIKSCYTSLLYTLEEILKKKNYDVYVTFDNLNELLCIFCTICLNELNNT